MTKNNFEKMMRVIDEAFATRQDPDQLQMNQAQRHKLRALHPSTMLEKADDNGPLIWVLLIPTTKSVMDLFLAEKISEKQLLEQTPLNESYDSIYLCSVTTLPELRHKGETLKLCLYGIESIRKDHPIRHLFVWPFTAGGRGLSQAISERTGLPLLMRNHQ